jgi:hypothetical protein
MWIDQLRMPIVIGVVNKMIKYDKTFHDGQNETVKNANIALEAIHSTANIVNSANQNSNSDDEEESDSKLELNEKSRKLMTGRS